MPGSPSIVSSWKATSRRRYRHGWFGRMILQVEEERQLGVAMPGGCEWSGVERRWRDARLTDFKEVV